MLRSLMLLLVCQPEPAPAVGPPAPPLHVRAAGGDAAAVATLVKSSLAVPGRPGRGYQVGDNSALRRAIVAGSKALAAIPADADAKSAEPPPIVGAGPETVAREAVERGIPTLAGLRVPPDLGRRIAARNLAAKAKAGPGPAAAPAAPPAHHDWRERGFVKVVDDQYTCGCCWNFATTGAAEASYAIVNHYRRGFSKQFVLDVAAQADGFGCQGGWWAFDVIETVGVPRATELPYAEPGAVAPPPDPTTFPRLYKVANWGYVAGQVGIPPVAQIKQAILAHGPVVAGIDATPEFMQYAGGVFDEPGDGATVDHAIQLVGWDDAKGPQGAWILKNSWGQDWGTEGGFAYVAYGAANVGFGAAWVDAAIDPDPAPAPAPARAPK